MLAAVTALVGLPAAHAAAVEYWVGAVPTTWNVVPSGKDPMTGQRPGVSGPGAAVPPGGAFTYKLEAGPGSAGVWPYHDHSPSMMDSITGGMYGALSILARGEQAPNREFVVFFESRLKLNTIDGLAFIGNTPTCRVRVGDVVQWGVLALGDDTHSVHVHGHRWPTADGTRDVQVVSRPRRSASTGRRTRSGPGSTTAMWRAT